MSELADKLKALREVIERDRLGGVRLLSTDTGIAEVWVTAERAWVLTDAIETRRLAEEEVPGGGLLELWTGPWTDPAEREQHVATTRGPGPIASDRPTAQELAGAGAEALWSRGIHPALTLVGGEARLPIHRHATPSPEKLGARAMLVFCGRRHGLFANLTRFVNFRPPAPAVLQRNNAVAWSATVVTYEFQRQIHAPLAFRRSTLQAQTYM